MREITNATTEQLIKFTTFNGFYTEKVMHDIQNELSKEKEIGKDKPYYRAYLNIVKRTAELIKNLGIEDSFTKCSFFYYLLWLGVFSKDHNFTFATENRISNMSALGADIMLGKAACLNNSDMLSRILRATGTEAYIIGCDVPDIVANPKLTSNRQPTLKQNNSNNQKLYPNLATLDFYGYGNHALSLFAFNDLYYLADPTNQTFLSITNLLEATYAGEKVKAQLKPTVTLMLEEVDPKHFKDLIIKSFIYSDKDPISSNFITDHYHLTQLLIARNIRAINQFYETIEPDIDIVCKTLK